MSGRVTATGPVRAFIFERNHGGAAAWGLARKLLPADGSPVDRFGLAVAISGDVVVVGAPFDDDNDHGIDSGSAYLFGRNVGGANAWGQAAKLFGGDVTVGDQFGSSVALQGSTLFIGAPRHDERGPDAGAAYQFAAGAGAVPPWVQTNQFLPDTSSVGGEFGLPVALDSGTVAIGARFDDDRGKNSGSVSVFRLRDNNRPQLALSIAAQSGIKNSPFNLVLPADNFTDPDVLDTLTLSASGPAWLAFNAGTRTFSGTPPVAGTDTVTLTATDREGLAASTTFAIVVTDPGIVIVPVPGSGPTLRTITTDPNFVLLSFEGMNTGPRGVLEVSSNLLTWTAADPLVAANIATPTNATTDTVTYYLPRAGVTGLNRFFRLRIDP